MKKGSNDPFKGLMGGIKTCKKIMNNEFEYVPRSQHKWPSSEKEIIRNQNKKVELTRYKGARGSFFEQKFSKNLVERKLSEKNFNCNLYPWTKAR